MRIRVIGMMEEFDFPGTICASRGPNTMITIAKRAKLRLEIFELTRSETECHQQRI
jgi:hypothetical protein